ncbi:Eco57I restriction-modification methylase domain-containing protein [Effusibacillus pohliae]|uniref:Eco57I restriction-modification methylase domain-containing protein n=1 Tax=Effusibacillus pohliae TaxID=232270 RepID=UPI0003611BFB|nr:N-6 DNA methylase [Effusibacillus pohliae]
MDLGTPNRGHVAIGALTVDLTETEEIRLTEQNRLDEMSTAAERNALGQFATPPQLARDIAQFVASLWGQREDRIRFLEPAVGSGSFYSALLQTIPKHRWNSALGIEIDPKFANIARKLWRPFGLEVQEADFTRLVPPESDKERANLIVTNPPYVRHHHLDRETKVWLKAQVKLRLGLDISGLAGLYCYYLLLSDAWLASEGISIWLIPTEFMEVNYGATLRRYLTERVTLLHVHVFDRNDVQFDDALVSSAIVVFQKKQPQPNHEVTLSFGNSLTAPKVTTKILAGKLGKIRKWTSLVTSSKTSDDKNIDQITLSSLFIIKRGLATGANDFFILHRSEAKAKGIPEKFLKPVLPSPRYMRETVIEAQPDGYPVLPDQYCLIDSDLPEDVIKREYPDFWAYLEQGKAMGVHKGYLASKRKRWYQQENREPAPFLCTYLGRDKGGKGKPFRFIWNKSRALATNTYLLLYPTELLAEALKKEESLYAVIFGLLQNIDVADLLGEGRMYGGGLYKLEPSELGRVPATKFLEAINGVVEPRGGKG